MIFRRRRELEAAPDPDVRIEDTVPETPSDRAKRPLVVIGDGVFTLLLLLALGVGSIAYFGQHAFSKAGPLASDKVVNIVRGSGLGDIADQLGAAGVIDRPALFQAGIFAYRARDKLKAGEYLFPARASMREVMDILVSGKAIEHSVTVPEGLTSEQIVARLLADDMLAGELRQTPREGSLLPETYRYQRGTTREQLAQRMAAAQKKALDEVWAARAPNLPFRSPQELVTMASIVEKETGKPEERPRVAAVFINRIGKRMRLQSDPTIIYGLVAGRGPLGRGLTVDDIRSRTPYNTYIIDGLPPGPIANPGRASLEAAARPAATRDLFFVADGSGGHAFAETLADHNRNVARWRTLERSAGSGDALPPVPPGPGSPPPAPSSPGASSQVPATVGAAPARPAAQTN